MTSKQLASEYAVDQVRVSKILREAAIEPIGKLKQLDEATGKVAVGRPVLAFDMKDANAAMRKATQTTTETKDVA